MRILIKPKERDSSIVLFMVFNIIFIFSYRSSLFKFEKKKTQKGNLEVASIKNEQLMIEKLIRDKKFLKAKIQLQNLRESTEISNLQRMGR